MTLAIREAGYNPQCDQNVLPGASPPCFNSVINPTATSFTLQMDWNGNGAIQPGNQVAVNYVFGGVVTPVNRGAQVTYSVVGGNLERQESAVDAQTQILVTSVQQAGAGGALQPFFQYLDANGQVIGARPPQPAWTPL